MPEARERLRADLGLLLVSAIWGSAFVAQRVASLQGAVFLFNGARFLLGALVLLLPGRMALRAGRDFWGWAVLAGLALFLASALQQMGLRWTTAANAGFLTALYVVFVPLLAWLGWRERPGKLLALAVLLSVLGAFLLSGGGQLRFHVGDLLELAGAVVWALHMLLLGKVAVRFHPLAFSFGQFLICGLGNLLAGLLLREAPLNTASLIVPVLYTGILSVGLGYTLQVWAQRHTPPADAALIMSLEAVFAALFGWWMLSEGLDPAQVVGAALILAAVLLAQLRVAGSPSG